jgi:hypothetical protein
MTEETLQDQAKAKRHRSPAYPGINLAQAIERVGMFYAKEHRNPASFVAAANHWGYAQKSSGAFVAVAALKSFGLINELDAATGRTIQLSPLGLRIVADNRPESVSRMDAIREAALRPKIHAEIWKKYNGRLPSDAELQFQLENHWNFNLNSIPIFMKELKDTIRFAKLTEADTIGNVEEDEGDKTTIKTGDYVQWVSQGAEQFRRLKKVSSFTDDGKYAFLEGEKTAVPVEELEVGEAPMIPSPIESPLVSTIRRQPLEGNLDMRQDVFSLDNGGEVKISWPVPLTQDMVTDIKDWLKIVERKISRSVAAPTPPESE